MKKTLMTTLITIIMLTGVTIGLFVWISNQNKESALKGDEKKQMELDEGKTKEYIYSTPEEAIPLLIKGSGKNVLTFDTSDTYNVDVSAASKQRLEHLKQRTSVPFHDPIIAHNPFGTSENTFYFYFETNTNLSVRYTITSQDKEIVDFSRMVFNGKPDNLSKVHEFTVRGIVPGRENFIIIGLYGADGVLIEKKVYKFNAQPTAFGRDSTESVSKGKSDEESTEGLYFVFPKDKSYILTYDNSGIVRGVIKQKHAVGKQMIENNHSFYYSVSKNQIAKVSTLGQVTGVYTCKGYDGHSDFEYDGYGNLYVVAKKANKKNKKHSENELIQVNIKTGKVRKVISIDSSVAFHDITLYGEGKAIVRTSKPQGALLVDGIASNVATKVTGVVGEAKNWKNTKYSKKVIKDKKKIPAEYKNEEGYKQSYEGHIIACSPKEGKYGEYDSIGKLIKEFKVGFPILSVAKKNLKGSYFY